jgi:polar amino acid transport system substrate-binding protein
MHKSRRNGMTSAAASELAPTGKLRAGMNFGNTLYTSGRTATGDPVGVSADLMRELAKRLGVPLEIVNHASPGQVADAVDANTWDVAILAIEQARAVKIAFSPPMSEIEATYAVRQDSPLRTAAQADAAGVRIAAPDKAGYELYLTRTLKNATLVRTASFADSIALFNTGGAEALAALKPNLLESMGQLPGARLLEGNFMVVNHGLGTPRARGTAGAAWLEAFVKDINASGFIARSIERHGVKGLSAVSR